MEHSNPARGLTALYLTFLLASCGGSSQPADCVQPPTEVFVSAEEVPLELRELSPGITIEGFGIRALRGCEDLDGPLAAFNWWTVRVAEGSDEYGAQVSQFLIAKGARIIAFGDVQVVIEAPPGRAPDDTPWIQATLQLPLYPSARDMAGMLASREYLEIGAFKLTEQDNDDYNNRNTQQAIPETDRVSPPSNGTLMVTETRRVSPPSTPRGGAQREGQGCRCAQSLQAWRIGLQSSGMLSGRAQCLSAALPPRLASACWKHLLWTVQRIHASHSASSWQGAVVVGGSVPASLLPALLGAGSLACSPRRKLTAILAVVQHQELQHL